MHRVACGQFIGFNCARECALLASNPTDRVRLPTNITCPAGGAPGLVVGLPCWRCVRGSLWAFGGGQPSDACSGATPRSNASRAGSPALSTKPPDGGKAAGWPARVLGAHVGRRPGVSALLSTVLATVTSEGCIVGQPACSSSSSPTLPSGPGMLQPLSATLTAGGLGAGGRRQLALGVDVKLRSHIQAEQTASLLWVQVGASLARVQAHHACPCALPAQPVLYQPSRRGQALLACREAMLPGLCMRGYRVKRGPSCTSRPGVARCCLPAGRPAAGMLLGACMCGHGVL